MGDCQSCFAGSAKLSLTSSAFRNSKPRRTDFHNLPSSKRIMARYGTDRRAGTAWEPCHAECSRLNFGGFSPESLAGRIEDCSSNVVITADEGVRGGRKVPLKANTDAAIEKAGGVDHVIVVRHTGGLRPRP